MSDQALPELRSTSTNAAVPVAVGLVGEVVYLYAFDLAYEFSRRPLQQLLGQPVTEFKVDPSHRGPRHLLFFKPQMVRFPVQERHWRLGCLQVEITVKILPIGAISIAVRVPFSVFALPDLVHFHDLKFNDGSLNDEVLKLAGRIRDELRPILHRPVEQLSEEEAYTVFCIHRKCDTQGSGALRAEVWLETHRREVAALLTQEPTVNLSRQEVTESTGRSLSYYEDDLVVIDWDSALAIDQPSDLNETIHILELANLQLTELEAYDRHPGCRTGAKLPRSSRESASSTLRSSTRITGTAHRHGAVQR
jgi:hypothetical protein